MSLLCNSPQRRPPRSPDRSSDIDPRSTSWHCSSSSRTGRKTSASLIVSNDTLSVFPPEELRADFDGYCDKLGRDFDFGKVDAVAAISKLRAKPDQARAVIAIGLVIGHADGSFDAAERKVVSEACHAVGIAPSEFDL